MQVFFRKTGHSTKNFSQITTPSDSAIINVLKEEILDDMNSKERNSVESPLYYSVLLFRNIFL